MMATKSKTRRSSTANPVLPIEVPVIVIPNLPPVLPRTAQPVRARASDTDEGAKGAFIKEPIIGDFSSHFKYEYVPVDKLLVDGRYQRDAIPEWQSQLAHSWNEDKNNPFIVSLRENGNYYVMDGQQRHGALQLMSNPPDVVFAKVFSGLTLEEEADLFVSAAEDRRGLTTYARFRAALTAGHEWAVAVHRAAEAAGFKVGSKGANNNISAIAAARDIYRRRGEPFLTNILRTVGAAWPNQPNSARSGVVYGMEYFMVKYPTADNRRLIIALSGTSPTRLEATGHGYAETLNSSINPAIGYAIYKVYNHNLRTNQLPAWSW